MSRQFKIHGSGPFAGICVYASIRHLSLFGEGVVMEFDPIEYPENFPGPYGEKTFSNLEINMDHFAPMLNNNVSSDLFLVDPSDRVRLWTAWAKWHGSIVEMNQNDAR